MASGEVSQTTLYHTTNILDNLHNPYIWTSYQKKNPKPLQEKQEKPQKRIWSWVMAQSKM